MSAVAVDRPPRPHAGPGGGALRPMQAADLDAVLALELRAYPFPWTRGIFEDCLRAGYPAWVLHEGAAILGYAVLSVAAGEGHILNVCVDPALQRRGHGRRLLRALLHLARGRGAQRLFLEVRPSNPGAIALYESEGFNEIGRRPRYYPAHDGREDAIVMAMELLAWDPVS
jgi:[ribosomal protein S18]-alanine N-acetyltransferase